MDKYEQKLKEVTVAMEEVDNGEGINDDGYVKLQIQFVKELLEKERGRHSTKRLNLGDTISTKIETPLSL